MIDNYIDHSDEKKTRRGLLAVAIATIFVCNMDFGASTLKLLGLEFIIDQSRLVAFGQIATGLLLFIYLIRSSPVYLSLLRDLIMQRISRQESVQTNRLLVRRDGVFSPEYPYGPQGELQAMGDRFTYLRARTEERFSIITALMGAMAILVVDFGVPLTVGTIAAFNPGKVSSYIDEMVKQQFDAISREDGETATPETEPLQLNPAILPRSIQPEPLP